MAEEYKIQLGVDVDVSDIQKQITEKTDKTPIPIKIEIENLKELKTQIQNLGKDNKNLLKIDTSDIKTSLSEVSSAIKEIKTSIGTLDSKSGMKSLLSSINQISTAIDKASDKFEELNANLKTLSSKDFSINLGVNMGGSNPIGRNAAYGNKVRNETLPQLKQQMNELVKYYNSIYKSSLNEFEALQKLVSGTKLGTGDFFENFLFGKDSVASRINSGSLASQMQAYKQYIDMFKQAASLRGLDLTSVISGFSKTSDDLIKDAQDIQTGANEIQDGFEKLKQVFGNSGIDANNLSKQLDSIVVNLGEIKTTIQGLSSGVSLDGLTQSFDRLSTSIENLLANAEKVKGVLNNNLGNSTIGGTFAVDTTPIKSAQQIGEKIGKVVTKSAQQSINLDDVIDEQVLALMNKFSISGDKGSKAFNEIRQALVECRNELNILKNSDIGIDEEVFDTSRAVDKVTDAIANQMRAVNSLGDEYVELANYMTRFNDPAKGNKVHLPDVVRQEQGDDYRSSRSSLGIAFNTERGISFVDFINDLNHELGDTISLTNGEAAAMDELLRKVELGRKQRDALKKSDRYLTSIASTEEILEQNGVNREEIYVDTMSAIDAANAAEQEAARISTETANTVVQNEERKQQAYHETADAYEKISRDTSLVRDDADFQKVFKASNQAAQEAQKHFQELLADEKAIVSVTEQFDNGNILRSFIVNIKRASGEVETLRYAIDKLNDEENENFRYQGASASDSKVEKQLEKHIKKANDLQIKLDKIKSGYQDMGASKPIKDLSHIESLDEQYKKVEKAIIDVGNADDSTFSSMLSNAEKEKTALENMVREYRNAENVATSLRSKDISTVKSTYASDLDILIQKMKDADIYTSGFQKGTENLRTALSNATNKTDLVSFLNGLDKLEAGYKRAAQSAKSFASAETYGKRAQGLAESIKNIQRISPEINEFEVEINGAKVSVQSLLTALSQVKTKGDFDSTNEDLKVFKKAAEAAGIAIRETVQKTKSINDIKIKINDTGFNGFEQEFRRAHLEAEKLENSSDDLENALRRLDSAMAGVYSADQINDAKRLIAANEEYENALKQVYSQLKLNQQAEKDAFNTEMLSQKKASLSSEMEIWLKENTRAAKDFGEEIRRLQASLDGLDANGVKLAGQQFKNITKQAQAMGKTGLTVFDKLKSKAKEYMAYLSAAEMFMYAEQAFRSMFEAVKEIDTAMTGLYRVTDLTSAEYDSLFNNMINSAKEYGATLNDIINATTDWVRAGFDANTSLGLAEVTTMYQHISDLDYDTAAENLITAYNGFKDELNGAFSGDTVSAVEYIADIFNELDNNFAVTSAGLGEALTRSASALDLAGNSIQETAGMVTGIVEVTQDPEKAGSALKVLSLRLRGMKGQLEELGEETDENVENVSKMQGQILKMTGGKVNIFDGTEFRSTYEIMRDIANVYDDLSSTDQADLLETIAGKNRANDVAALLSNWENVEAAVKSASEAEGSAARENAKYVDSIQGRLDKLTTSWQSFANTFMSSDFLKGAVSGLTKFVEGLEKVVDIFGTFPTLMGTIATGMSIFKNKGFFSVLNKDMANAQKQLSLFGKSFKDISRDFQSGQGLFTSLFSKSITKADVGYITEYFNQVKSGVNVGQAYTNTLSHASVAGKKMAVSIKSGKVSMDSLKTATIGGKAALFGLEVAATAANIALTMGLSLAIQGIVNLVSKWINADKELAESVDEITSKFKEQSEELKKLQGDYDIDNESSMISRYEKLSKGVDNLGRNVSLTTDEYLEYQSIVNKIAEQFPTLISGYDAQGNALLSCKGNVEELTEAYEKLIHAQNNEVLTNSKDIAEDFENVVKKAESDDGGFLGLGTKLSSGAAKIYKDILNSNKDTSHAIDDALDDPNTWKSGIRLQGQDIKALADLLEDADFERQGNWWNPELDEDYVKRAFKENKDIVNRVLDDFYANLEAEVEGVKSIAQATLSEAFDVSSAISGLNYGNISEDLQAVARQVVNGLDYDFFSNLQEQGKTVEQWTKEMLNQLNAISKENNAQIEAGFDLQTKFNGGEISYGEYVANLRDLETTIDRLDLKDEVKEQLKISLNLDENGILDQYDALLKRLTSKEIGLSNKTAKNFLNSLSVEELSVLVDIIPQLDAGTTLDEIKSLINDQLAQEFKFDITFQTEGIEALNTALAESRSAAGLTSESIAALTARYEDLDGFNAAALFEKTANGIRLNSNELSRLEEQYVNTNKLEIDKNLNTLVEKYQDVNNKLKTNTSLTADERKELENSKESLANKIDELSTLASQYDGLTSAFTKWQNAMNGAEEGDNYDSVFENLEAMKELDDKGLVGTDKYKAFAQLFSYEDLSSASIDKIGKAYDKGYKKATRYFTEGQKGSKNFLNDLHVINSEWAHINKNGVWEVDINAEEAAKKLGISVEAVLLILDKLKDYGIKVEVEDSSVNNLKTKIQETEAKLKELGQSPVDINVDIEASSANLGKIESEIEKAKSKIAEINNSSVSPEVKTAQLEDARAKLEALIDKKIEASQPAFMNLNTSQVNASLVDALEKIQSYQDAINEVNKLSELKEAGISIDDSQLQTAKEKVDECAKAIQGLDGEVKMAIGLEEDGSIDSIKKSFEEEKVKIDANTDPALNKIEQLAENVEKIEDKDVTINVAVNGLKDVKTLVKQVQRLDKKIDLATKIEGSIDKLSEYTENAKALKKIGNVTSSVTAEVKGNVIDTFEYKIDNLKVFSDSAKDIHSIGHVSSKVAADIEGNIFDNGERTIDNLKVYTDSAKDIKKFEGNISSKITADIDGDVFDKNESTINNLEVFVDSAKGIKEIEGNITSNITANTLGSVFTDKERSIDNLDVYIESAKGIRDIEGNIVSNITADANGSVFTDSERTIDNLKVFIDSAKGIKDFEGDTVSNITANTLGNVFTDSERTTDNLKTFIESANGIKDIQGDIVSNITANTLGSVFTDKERSIDNLGVFIESAKGIKDIEGDIVSNITANTLGSVFTDKERSIDNLKVFTESAKGIKDIEGDIVSNITANTLGSVFTDPERETNNLKVFVDSAKGIKDIEGDIVSNITANTLGSVFTDKERSINNLKVFIDSAKGIKEIEGNISSKITADVDGNVFDKYETTIDNVGVFVKSAKGIKSIEGDISSKVTANVYGNVLTSEDDKISNLGVFADNANKLKGLGNFSSSVSANATGNVVEGEGAASRLSSLTEFKSIVSGMTNQTVTVSVTAKVDSENVNAAIDLLKKVADSGVFKDYNATIQVGAKIAKIDDAVVQNYKAPSKDSTVKYSVDPASSVYTWTAPSKEGVVNYSASVEALTDAQKHKTGTITYKANIIGFGGVANGTANANGSAFANGTSGKAFKQGDWSVKKTTTALTGELGQELVVYKNRWYTVGDNGAEFATIPKGAIVFNHKQTAELFKNGKVTSDGGRGKALSSGTAFASGTAFEGGSGMPKEETNTDKFEETFDWIDTILSRLERTIDNLDETVNNAHKSWSERNTASRNEISKVKEKIVTQGNAYGQYIRKANLVGLPSSWAKKVREGTIDIEPVTDENLADKIKEYQTWYEKALECKDAVEELRETEAELYVQRVENASAQYEGILGVIGHEKSMLDEYISQNEANAQLVSANYYDALIKNERGNLTQLQNEKSAMLTEFQNAMKAKDPITGKPIIAEGSEAWHNMIAAIDDVTLSIAESETQLKEYQQTIQQLSFETFDLLQEKISAVTEESDFLIELMSNDKLHDDNGQLTDEGKATMGLHGQNYNTYMYQADQAAAEAERLKTELAKDPYDTELEKRYREMIALQQEYILSAESEKDAIRDLVEDGISVELDALQGLIDKKNETLESEKDLYEYQKKVKEQTEEIASLEKQLAAYSGDNSEEARQKVQQIKLELENAKEALAETEYDKMIQDSQQMLDDLYEQYSEILNTRLDNVDALLENVISQINTDATSISATLSEKADSVGYALSDSMKTIWDENTTDTTNVITTYGEKFSLAQTTTNNSLSTINTNLQNMITQLNSIAKTKVQSASISSAANSKNTDTSKKESSKTETSKTPSTSTIKVGGKINAKGAQIYDYVGDKSGERQLYRNDPIYTVLGEKNGYLKVRWHKLSKGVTGWFKKSDVKAYATGKQNFLDDEIAWTQEKGQEFIVRPSDGAILTPIAKDDSVLTSTASNNIWDMANSPAEFIKDNLNFGTANVPNNSTVQSSYTQNLDKVVFNFPNVKNYDEMLSAMKKDPNFERLLLSMTIDQIAGKSSLAKGKSIR